MFMFIYYFIAQFPCLDENVIRGVFNKKVGRGPQQRSKSSRKGGGKEEKWCLYVLMLLHCAIPVPG